MADWNTVKLGTVGSFQNGEAFSSAFFNFEKKGLRLVRNRDLKNDDQIVYYNGEHGDHDVVNDGDLLVGMDGDFAPVIWKKGKALLNQRVGRVIVKDGVSQDYIYYALFSALAELEHVTSATTVKHLSSKTCLGLGIPLPPLAEQRKIAEILRTWDEAIETAEAELKAKKERKRWLMQDLLARNLRSGAPLKAVGNYFVPISERNSSGLPPLSVTQDAGVVFRSDMERRISYEKDSLVTYKVVRQNNFIISLRSFEGGIEMSEVQGCVSPAYQVFVAKSGICARYFRHYFKSEDFIKRLAVTVFGIRDGKQISFRDFSEVKIPIVPHECQVKFAEVSDHAETEIASKISLLYKLREQKRGLMQKLLTGEVRIPA
jgi:type I restriction enzyme S subunit